MSATLFTGESLTPDSGVCETCSRGRAVGKLVRHKDGRRLTTHRLCPSCLEKRYGPGWAALVDHDGDVQRTLGV